MSLAIFDCEIVSGGAELKEQKGEKAIRSLFWIWIKEAKIQAIISPVMTLTYDEYSGRYFWVRRFASFKGEFTAGTLVAIIFLMFQIIMPFAQMAPFFTFFQKAVGATERIQHILKWIAKGGR